MKDEIKCLEDVCMSALLADSERNIWLRKGKPHNTPIIISYLAKGCYACKDPLHCEEYTPMNVQEAQTLGLYNK